jgi:hypothetical protein
VAINHLNSLDAQQANLVSAVPRLQIVCGDGEESGKMRHPEGKADHDHGRYEPAGNNFKVADGQRRERNDGSSFV